MTAYLEGNWERSEASPADPGALARFRLFCVASNAVDALRVSNYNNAWRTDGSEIGRATLYEVAPNPGSYSAPIAGSLYSGALSYAVPNPPTLASGRVYPTAVRSAGGGWRYEPLDPGLSRTFALPAEMNAGYPSDVQIEIAARSSSSPATFMRATVTALVFDARWNTLWLEEELGDGWAREHVRVVNRRTVATVGFATTYSAWWRTAYFQPDGSQVPGIAGFRVDTTVVAGSYWLSALVAAGLAVTTPGYLHTTPVNTPHYVVR